MDGWPVVRMLLQLFDHMKAHIHPGWSKKQSGIKIQGFLLKKTLISDHMASSILSLNISCFQWFYQGYTIRTSIGRRCSSSKQDHNNVHIEFTILALPQKHKLKLANRKQVCLKGTMFIHVPSLQPSLAHVFCFNMFAVNVKCTQPIKAIPLLAELLVDLKSLVDPQAVGNCDRQMPWRGCVHTIDGQKFCTSWDAWNTCTKHTEIFAMARIFVHPLQLYYTPQIQGTVAPPTQHKKNKAKWL